MRRRNDDVEDGGYCTENYRRHQFRRKLGSVYHSFPELIMTVMTMTMIMMAAMMILCVLLLFHTLSPAWLTTQLLLHRAFWSMKVTFAVIMSMLRIAISRRMITATTTVLFDSTCAI